LLESFDLKQKSKQLLEIAKIGVEKPLKPIKQQLQIG
jgi:hypothetical protein